MPARRSAGVPLTRERAAGWTRDGRAVAQPEIRAVATTTTLKVLMPGVTARGAPSLWARPLLRCGPGGHHGTIGARGETTDLRAARNPPHDPQSGGVRG